MEKEKDDGPINLDIEIPKTAAKVEALFKKYRKLTSSDVTAIFLMWNYWSFDEFIDEDEEPSTIS